MLLHHLPWQQSRKASIEGFVRIRGEQSKDTRGGHQKQEWGSHIQVNDELFITFPRNFQRKFFARSESAAPEGAEGLFPGAPPRFCGGDPPPIFLEPAGKIDHAHCSVARVWPISGAGHLEIRAEDIVPVAAVGHALVHDEGDNDGAGIRISVRDILARPPDELTGLCHARPWVAPVYPAVAVPARRPLIGHVLAGAGHETRSASQRIERTLPSQEIRRFMEAICVGAWHRLHPRFEYLRVIRGVCPREIDLIQDGAIDGCPANEGEAEQEERKNRAFHANGTQQSQCQEWAAAMGFSSGGQSDIEAGGRKAECAWKACYLR